MIDKAYWKDVVLQLTNKEKANWAAHVIATNREILQEILRAIGREKVIANCLLCYSVILPHNHILMRYFLVFRSKS